MALKSSIIIKTIKTADASKMQRRHRDVIRWRHYRSTAPPILRSVCHGVSSS